MGRVYLHITDIWKEIILLGVYIISIKALHCSRLYKRVILIILLGSSYKLSQCYWYRNQWGTKCGHGR